MWGTCLVQPPGSSDLSVAEGESVGNVSGARAVSRPGELGRVLYKSGFGNKVLPSPSSFHVIPNPNRKENWSIPCINRAF